MVTTGVDTSLLYVNGMKSNWLLTTSNAPARSNAAALCRPSYTLASTPGSSS